ncbi:MAG: hypothetical protein V3R99_01735 [Thermoguttaceae bacterium]
MSNSSDGWKAYFSNWPETMAKKGILITNFDEQIPFAGFLASDSFLLLDRQTPDALGARTVILPYGSMTALKLTDVVDQKVFHSIGFEGSLKKR